MNFGGYKMIVVGLHKVLNWCQVITKNGTYTCPLKEIDGELFFRFKKAWHPVAKYISEHAKKDLLQF